MNKIDVDLIVEVAELARSFAEIVIAGSQNAAALTAILILILQKCALAYQQHTGQAFNFKLIRVAAAA